MDKTDKVKFDFGITDDLLSPDSMDDSVYYNPVTRHRYSSINENVPSSEMIESRSLENIVLDNTPMDESRNIGVENVLGQSFVTDYVEPASSSDETADTIDESEMPISSGCVQISESTFQDLEQSDLQPETGKRDADVSGTDAEMNNLSIVEPHLLSENQTNTNISKTIPEVESAVSIAFVEEKGVGLKMAESTRSLCNFFTEDNTGGTDAEGKSFFDNFTAPEEVCPVVEPSSPTVISNGESASNYPSGSATASNVLPSSPVTSPDTYPYRLSSSFESDRCSGEIVEKRRLSVPDKKDMPLDSDDLFSASVLANDADRSNDAWIASDETKQVLVAALTSHPGSVITLAANQSVKPQLQLTTALGDPVKELVQQFLGEQESSKRVTLTASSVSHDETGLRQLINAECWNAAVDLTGRLLEGQKVMRQTGHTVESVQLWYCRLALLVKLKKYSEAEKELISFGNLDTADLYFECHQDLYPMRRGSMIPFDMRVLAAELPQYLGNPLETMDRLHYLLAVVRKILSNLDNGLAEDGSMLELSETSRSTSKQLWESREIRVLYSLVHCVLNIKDYNNAISTCETLISKDKSHELELLYAIGRIYLQMGDLKSARQYFNSADLKADMTEVRWKCHSLTSRGLLAMANNQFSEAHQLFQEVVHLNNKSLTAINNLAVCLLYLGQLKSAVQQLETVINAEPQKNLQHGVLLNLATLYELESSKAPLKKQNLLSMVNKYKGDSFPVGCLKLI